MHLYTSGIQERPTSNRDIAELRKGIHLKCLLKSSAKCFRVGCLQRGKTNPQGYRCFSQQLSNWGRNQYSCSRTTAIPAGTKYSVKSTLLAVHCHGVYEVAVSAFSSPGTHAGWWKGLEKLSIYPCHSTLPLRPGLLEYLVAYRTNEKTKIKTCF